MGVVHLEDHRKKLQQERTVLRALLFGYTYGSVRHPPEKLAAIRQRLRRINLLLFPKGST